jgi:hypothetical protein
MPAAMKTVRAKILNASLNLAKLKRIKTGYVKSIQKNRCARLGAAIFSFLCARFAKFPLHP